MRISEYLSQILDKDNIFENIVTPYGYNIEFILSFDHSGKIVSLHSSAVKRR